LVAYTIPRSRCTAQSSRSAKLNVQKTLAKTKRSASNEWVWLFALSARPRFAGKIALLPVNRIADEVLYIRPEVAGNGSSRNSITVQHWSGGRRFL